MFLWRNKKIILTQVLSFILSYVVSTKLDDCIVFLTKFVLLNNYITKTCLFKYTENFTTQKKENFQIKNSDIFHISAQNIDCGNSLELPQRVSSNESPQSMFEQK